MKKNKNALTLKGFIRTQIVDKKGKIVGDSGFIQNQLTNLGMGSCFALRLMAAGEIIASIAFGSASTPASSATALSGHAALVAIATAAAGSANNTYTAQMTAQLAGGDTSFHSDTPLGNIGLVGSASNRLFAGVGFATSSLGTDQSVNVTYNIEFGR